MSSKQKRNVAVISLLLLVAGLYLVTMPIQYTVGDSWDEVALASSPQPVCRAYHLLTTVVNRLTIQAGSLVLPGVKNFIVLQILMIAASLLAGLGIYKLVLRFVHDNIVAVIAAASFFLSAGVWLQGRSVEVGMIPLALLTWSIFLIIRGSTERRTPWLIFAGGILYALSVLFALNHIILFPAIIALLFVDTNTKIPRPFLFKFVGLVSACLIVPFLFIGYFFVHIGSPSEFFAWMLYHRSSQFQGHFHFGITALFRSLSGFMNLYVVNGGATTWFRTFQHGEKIAGLDPFFPLRFAIGIGMIVFVFGSMLFSFKTHRRIGSVILIAFFFNLIFCMFWLGSDPQFWLPVAPFALLSMALACSPLIHRNIYVRTGFLAGIVVFGVLNIPLNEPSLLIANGGKLPQVAERLQHIFKASDILLTPGGMNWRIPGSGPEIGPMVIDMGNETRLGSNTDGAFANDFITFIHRSLREQNNVFLDGFFGIRYVDQVGWWESSSSFRNIQRDELVARILKEFDIQMLYSYEGINLAQVHERNPVQRQRH